MKECITSIKQRRIERQEEIRKNKEKREEWKEIATELQKKESKQAI